MILQAILFYSFALTTVFAALLVISLKNPVHSVLSLILTFFCAAWLFIILGAEYIAMLLIIVYVGAVAVLFLFVVMMMDINFAELKQGFLKYLPLGAFIGLLFFAQLYVVISHSHFFYESNIVVHAPQTTDPTTTNAHAIGKILYTDYFYLFQLSGLVLLVAMIGAIVLTLRHRDGVRRQKAGKQINRKRKDSVELVKVKPGQGA